MSNEIDTSTQNLKTGTDPDYWKEAVIDACVIDCIGWYEDDPRRTIQELCAYEADIALDPRVSSDAKKLVDETIDNCAMYIVVSASLWSNLPPDKSRAFANFLARNLREQKERPESWNLIREIYESIYSEANEDSKESE